MAWTPFTRRHHDRSLRYASDLTDREWSMVEPFMPSQPLHDRLQRQRRDRRCILPTPGTRRDVGKLEEFAASMRPAPRFRYTPWSSLGFIEPTVSGVGGGVDGISMRQIIRTVLRRVEIDDAHVEVVFRVPPLDDPAVQNRQTRRPVPRNIVHRIVERTLAWLGINRRLARTSSASRRQASPSSTQQ